jgi:uncharacterized membrane protein YidH (DUF202 family)
MENNNLNKNEYKQRKPVKKVKKRTLLSKERTLLAEIRTSSIFIGITFLIYFKIHEPLYKKILLIILSLISIINTFLVFYFYNEQIKNNRGNSVSVIASVLYGLLLSILILISVIYLFLHLLEN